MIVIYLIFNMVYVYHIFDIYLVYIEEKTLGGKLQPPKSGGCNTFFGQNLSKQYNSEIMLGFRSYAHIFHLLLLKAFPPVGGRYPGPGLVY